MAKCYFLLPRKINLLLDMYANISPPINCFRFALNTSTANPNVAVRFPYVQVSSIYTETLCLRPCFAPRRSEFVLVSGGLPGYLATCLT